MNDKAKILVVDYRRNVFLATSRLLKEADYEVLEASSGKGSLKIIREDHPDLVFCSRRHFPI